MEEFDHLMLNKNILLYPVITPKAHLCGWAQCKAQTPFVGVGLLSMDFKWSPKKVTYIRFVKHKTKLAILCNVETDFYLWIIDDDGKNKIYLMSRHMRIRPRHYKHDLHISNWDGKNYII
jgi:hypothetical protein